MSALVWTALAKFWPIILGFLAALSGVIAARRSGAAKERAKQEKARLEAMTEAQKIDNAVAGNDPDANRKELGKWAR